jgi:hypothetical protein
MYSVVTVWNAEVLQIIVAILVWHVRKILHTYVISDLRRGLTEIFALLRLYAAYIGGYSPASQDNLSVPSSRVNQYKKTLDGGTSRLPETSINKYISTNLETCSHFNMLLFQIA